MRLPVNAVPPAVRLTSPADGASFASPAEVTLAVEWEPPESAAWRVEFFTGSEKLGEAWTAPYTLSWRSPAAGRYAVTARLTDALGRVVLSPAAVVTVK
jgi:hypothetical protein